MFSSRAHRCCSGVLLLLLPAAAVFAQEARTVPPEVLAAIADDGSEPLPRSLAPGETVPRLPDLRLPLAPPTGLVHTPAEYDRNLGLLVRWGDFNSVLTAITVAITTGDPDGRVWVIVSGAAQQASATTALTNAGADMSQVSFLTAATNSVWIRDYGPRFITEDGDSAIVDHTYNRPRPQDDAIPDVVAGAWGQPQYDIPLVHGGGNFHLFSSGEAFMTELILNENPGLSAQDVEDDFAAYEGLDLTIWPPFPSSYDSTQHIDMWMLPARNRRAIVGAYPPGDGGGVPFTVTEDAVAELVARGYTVFRTPGWRAGGTHYTYTNAVIFNKLVLVPSYNSYPSQNAAAVATFQAAFPGYQVIPIDSTQLVTFAGVIHCIIMHVPAPAWVFGDDFETGDFTSWSAVVN